MNFQLWLGQIYWHNTVREYLVAVGVFLVTLLTLYLFKRVILRKLRELVNRTESDVDDLIVATVHSLGFGFYFIISLYIALQFIVLPFILHQIFFYVFWMILTIYIILALHKIIDFCFSRVGRKEDLKYTPSVISLLKQVSKGVLWGIALILVLQNFGVNVGALLASLGIGGIAIGFALKDVLVDLLASLSIYLDRPFEVGDFIKIGGDFGSVEQIGFKSTRIRTVTGDELIVSNRQLTEDKVHNYGRMEKRRISFNLTFDADTPNKKLKNIRDFIWQLIKNIDYIKPDRVAFRNFTKYGLEFEVVYYVQSPDYSRYVKAQQKLNYRLKEKLEEEDVQLVFPIPIFSVEES